MIHRIMLVDDHAIVRDGLREVFADCTDITVGFEAGSGQEAMDLLDSAALHGVLLDLSMPDQNGMDTLRRMRARRATLPILILSMHAEEQYALNVLKAGANGYIAKSSAPHEILEATRTVLRGQRYVSPTIATHLATSTARDATQRSPHEQLSAREMEVFCKLAAGVSVSDIGQALFLSLKTVSTHRCRILGKMNLRSNADLTYYAIKNGLVE